MSHRSVADVARPKLKFIFTIAVAATVASARAHGQQAGPPLVPRSANAPAVSRRGFSLFADIGVAGASLKLTGGYRYAVYNAGGLCPFANSAGDEFNSSCGTFSSATSSSGSFFSIRPVWGVPVSQYSKIHQVWPDVARMLAPIGYSTPWRQSDVSPLTYRIGPADAQFGSYYSGLTSTSDGGCRDMSGVQGASLSNLVPLTALSNCPETWGYSGFQGMRAIPDSAWLQRFHQNPGAFRWDDWTIPASALGSAPFIGDLTTYGAFSDFNAATLALYGGVTPQGNPAQQPNERGFPLGIEVRYDAFKYDRRSLRDGVFVRWMVINKSAKVWNRGIDYDSIYMGVDPAYVSPLSIYNVPAIGAHVSSRGGLSGKCNTTSYPRRVGPGVSEACPGGPVGRAIHIILVLKSPIGDLRNKLFSNPVSSYYAPSNPKADDTITFNHWRPGGFGTQDKASWLRNDRALFGLISGREDLWLDGRSAADFSPVSIWRFFRYELTDGTQSAANIRYNRSVPGNISGYGKWDFNDDGVQDTLMLPDCGVRGCAKLWSDTTAGGFGTAQAGEGYNFLGVGPFSLKAGDTTEFIWYLGGATDTVAFNTVIRNVTDAYLANFSTFVPPPVPAITASDVQVTAVSPSATNQTSQIRIQVKMPSPQNDAYISRVVLPRLQSGDPAAVDVRRLNPGIVQAVQARLQRNVARVFVFKSCDGGKSWTDPTGTCESAANARTRTVTGGTAGLGWQAFRTIVADSMMGNLSTHVVSDVVPPGHEYLYSFVTQARGLADIPVVYQETVDGSGTVTSRTTGTLWDAIGVDVDTATSRLESSGSTTVIAYAPISVPAGTYLARIDTATRQGGATNHITTIARSASVDGAFRMRFGNRFILTRVIDTAVGTRSTTVVRQSVYARGANSPGDVPFTTNLVAAADTFVSAHDIVYAWSSIISTTCPSCVLRTVPRSTVGSVQTFVDTISQPGYVLARPNSGAEAFYLAVSSSTFTAITQPVDPYEGVPYYPGFSATVSSEVAPPFARGIGSHATVVLRGPADTLADSVAAAGVRYGPQSSGATLIGAGLRNSPGGVYRIQWQDDAFGPRAPFTFGTAAQMQSVLDASLGARTVAAYTDTSAAYRSAIVASAAGGDGPLEVGTRQLVRARVPFSVTGPNGQAEKLVMLTRHTPGNAADSILRNSRVFGTNGDTTRLAIPPDVWMAGDSIWVFESLSVDSTALISGQSVTIVRDTTINGRVQRLPIQNTRELLGMKLVLQCAQNATPTRVTCNPLEPGGRGASSYQVFQSGWEQVLDFNRPFDQNSEIALTATPTEPTARPLTKADMNAIRVVPNPYVVQSSFDRLGADGTTTARILFVNVPNEGMLRIYTVSGQMVQQLSWTASDLIASGDNSPHGDLPYNLRTREGRDLAGGLYLYVLTARGPNANRTVGRGKFVIIR